MINNGQIETAANHVLVIVLIAGHLATTARRRIPHLSTHAP
jgi:hypothetical protein